MDDDELESIASLADSNVRQLYEDFIARCVAHANTGNGYYQGVFFEYMKGRLDEPDFMYRVGRFYE